MAMPLIAPSAPAQAARPAPGSRRRRPAARQRRRPPARARRSARWHPPVQRWEDEHRVGTGRDGVAGVAARPRAVDSPLTPASTGTRPRAADTTVSTIVRRSARSDSVNSPVDPGGTRPSIPRGAPASVTTVRAAGRANGNVAGRANGDVAGWAHPQLRSTAIGRPCDDAGRPPASSGWRRESACPGRWYWTAPVGYGSPSSRPAR